MDKSQPFLILTETRNKPSISVAVQTENITFRRRLDLDGNDSMSTPPSVLRREILQLDDELIETHDFHDLEIKILREENEISGNLKNNDKYILDLEKSVKDAELIILESNKEINNLKSVNQDLNKKLKDEANNGIILKEQYQDQISKLQLSLKQKSLEIENLEKDKNDFDFREEQLRKNYEEKLSELKLLLQQKNEKESEIEKNAECDTLKQRLREESERVKELSKLVDNLNSELIVNKGKIEELEKQIRSKALRCSLKDALVQTDEDDSLTWAKRSSSFEKQIENFNLVSENISESSGNSYESENGDRCPNAVQILNETKYVVDVTVQTDKELHLNADDELVEIRRYFEDGLNSNSKECAVAFNTLFDKYLNLLDTYVALHTEFDDYKISEVKDCYSLVNKSVRYLDELCSQLQNSGSGSSIQTPEGTPMSGGKKTEQSLSRLVRTPLKFPFASPSHFRTPTVFNSPGVVNCQSDSSPLMSGIAADKGRELATLKNIYFQKLKTSEETIAEILKSVLVLEERISKLEGVFPVIQAERDELMKENICLRENFSKISSDISQIRSKLEVEIISLNPNLKATLSDVLIPDLLSLFLHTILESCKEIQKRSSHEKTLLNEKNEAYEGRILELNAEIGNLWNMVELLNEDKATCERKISESEKMEKDLLHKISEMIKKIEQYEVELTHLTEQKEKLSLDVQILHERNAQFKIEVSDSVNEVKCLINEVTYLSQNIEKLEMEIFASVKEKKELLNDLRMLLSKNEAYERETGELLTQITERTEQFQAEISELIQEKASLLTEVKTLREKNEQYKGEIAESAKDIEIFLSKVTVLTGKIEKYEAELSELAPQKEKLLSEIKDLRVRIDQYEREISESTKLKEALLQEMKVLNNMHETYEKGMFESEKLLANVKELTEMNKLCEAEIMESATVKEELLHVAKNDGCENEQILLIQIRELKEKNEEYKTEISELVPQKKKLATEICVLRKKTDQYEMEILELLMANKSLLEKMIILGDKHDEYFKNVYECDKLLIHVKTLTNKNRQHESEIMELVSEKERLFDEIKDLRKQIGQYETESFESSKKYGALLEELKTLSEKQETYEKRTYEFERLLADVKELTNKNEEYTVELSETTLHKEKLETEVSTLRETAEKYDIEILKLSKTNKALLEEIKILKDKHDVHQSEMVTELTKKNEEYESKISVLILQKDKLLAENCDLQKMLKHSKIEISEFVKKNEELSHQVKILNDKHEASEKKMCDSERLVADIKELVEKNEAYKTEISKLAIQKEKLVTMVWSLWKRIDQCETEMLESLKTTETLLEKIIILEDKHHDYFKSIYEYDKLAIDVRKLTKKNSEYESEISELILQRDNLQTENGDLKEMINHSQVDISELAKQNKELSDQMKILGNKQEELMNTNERYKLEIANSLKAKEELEKLNEANMTKIKENEGLFSIITERNEECETEITELVKVKNKLSSEVESLHRITEQYEATISDSVKVKNDLLNEVKILRSQNADHEKELKEMAAKNMLYQSELTELGILKEKLLKEIETLQREKDAEISELATEKEELLKHVDTLNKKVTEHEEKITILSDDMKALNEIKEQKIIEFAEVELKLSNQVKELTNKNEKYKNDMSDLKENLLIEVKALYERIEEYQSEILEATKAKENAIKELKLVSSNYQICERQLSEYRKMLSDATEKADAYEKQVTELIGAKEMLQLEMDALRERSNTFEKAIAECNDEIVKILALTGNQNIQKCTLIKSGTFEVDGKTLFDCFNNWVMLKTNEVEELKSQVRELDEECEMYAQRIREADKETVRALEEGRTVKKKLELSIRDLKEEISSLQKQLENLTELEKASTEWKKEVLSLRSQVKDLEKSLAQSKKLAEELDEECESYAQEVKNAHEEGRKLWQERETLQRELEKFQKERMHPSVSKAEGCQCKKDFTEIKELKSAIATREIRILELEQLNEKHIVHKSQIKYLENSLAESKKQLEEERERSSKLEAEIKSYNENRNGSTLLEKLRAMDSCNAADPEQSENKEKLNKLEKDYRILKELCRTRFIEIKRLQTENSTLKAQGRTTKNCNQMDSPIRTRSAKKQKNINIML